MRLIKLKNEDELAKLACSIISAEIISNPNCILGLATGSSPIKTYKRLIEAYENGILDFSRVITVNLDEYYPISESETQSYHYFMKENLFNHINIDIKNTHLPNGNADDIEKECERYENLISKLGYADLQVLGIGHNGHIGFNEPDDIFYNNVHFANLSENTINANSRMFNSKEEVPTQAITMGIGTIMRSKKIVLIAGADKKEIVEKLLSGEINPHIPASILQLHPDVTILLSEN